MLQNLFQEQCTGLLVWEGEGEGQKKLHETSLTIKILLIAISHNITGGGNHSGDTVTDHDTVAS